ncbi:MAG: AhpC/TSA family protein [Bacteroidales bacterium]|nr:AhpC/TSA family protein [Bacteroidales bacterium]
MKVYLFTALLSLSLAFSANAQIAEPYSIKGTLEGAIDGDTVALATAQGQSLTPLETTTIRSGQYKFSGNVEGAQLVYLVGVKDGAAIAVADIILEGGQQSITLYRSQDKAPDVRGCQDYIKWKAISNRYQQIYQQQIELSMTAKMRQVSPIERARAQASIDSLSRLRVSETVAYIRQNKDGKLADMLFEMNYAAFSQSDRVDLLALLSKRNPILPGARRIKEAVEAQERASRLAVGGQFIDFSMADPKGKLLHISDIIKSNKLTLIDFWASWCGPCRAEMPTVKAAYEKYKSKGLEIIGVSLDNTRGSWLSAIEGIGMPWLHVSDLQGWRCSAATLYNVKSIPSCYLVDKNGRIVAKDLRGQQLLSALNNLLGD